MCATLLLHLCLTCMCDMCVRRVSLCVCNMTHSWLIHSCVCDMTHSWVIHPYVCNSFMTHSFICVRHDSFTSHSSICVQHDAFIHMFAIWLIHMCATWLIRTRSCLNPCDDSFIHMCAIWLIHMCAIWLIYDSWGLDSNHAITHSTYHILWIYKMCAVTYSRVRRDSSICATWLIRTCDVTWRDSYCALKKQCSPAWITSNL